LKGPRTRLATLTIAAVALAACGGGSHFADRPRPALPVNVSVYVNDQRVSVSPPNVTPGAVAFTITNQSSSAQSVEVLPAGGSSALTTTGPISPQANDQVTVRLPAGQYSIGISGGNSTEATAATPTGIAAGTLIVAGHRSNSNGQLLQP
jgi:hypothetical protein